MDLEIIPIYSSPFIHSLYSFSFPHLPLFIPFTRLPLFIPFTHHLIVSLYSSSSIYPPLFFIYSSPSIHLHLFIFSSSPFIHLPLFISFYSSLCSGEVQISRTKITQGRYKDSQTFSDQCDVSLGQERHIIGTYLSSCWLRHPLAGSSPYLWGREKT